MKTLEEAIKDLENEVPKDGQAPPDELKKLDAKIRALKDLVEALIDLGTITGMWDTASIKIATKNVVKTPGPTCAIDVEYRQTHLKKLLLQDMQERRKG